MNFSKIELKVLHEAMWSIWTYIAGDVLECTGQSEADRDTVIEVVLDADRLESFFMESMEPDFEPDIVKKFRKLSYDEQIEIAKGRFTSETYS